VAEVTPRPSLLWACKGFEKASGLTAHRIVAEALPQARRVGALSGPSFAIEVAHGLPTALVLASADAGFASSSIDALSGQRLRVYSSADVIGVEIGGAVKNVIAIAAGICDGLALGRNARAALITRGLAEIVRFGVASGGRPETFMGLAGLGDLVLTCTADLSRNHRVGTGLAEGLPLDTILHRLGHVAEGVESAPALLRQARRMSIEMPITQAVCDVLAGSLSAPDAVQRLLARDPKPEQ
jgi:glycerol-3-phosphate dehydrogenase (NAD(P)+)